MKQCDVLVVGASFAGLSFAKTAAKKKLKVIVIDKDPNPGSFVRTTGIIFPEIPVHFPIPKKVFTNLIRKVPIFSPSLKRKDFETKKHRYYMTDTAKMLEWLSNDAKKAGAEIIGSAGFLKHKVKDGKIFVYTSDNDVVIECRFVIGADGTMSRVAKDFGLDANKKILNGFEYIISGVKMDPEAWKLFLDHDLAPGYPIWVAPNKDKVHFGVVIGLENGNPKDKLNLAMKKIKPVIDLTKGKIIGSHSGLIPVGGILKKIHNDKCLLIGDSAGMCGAFTCGGILPAMIAGDVGAKLVYDLLKRNKKKALNNLISEMNKKQRIIEHLNREKKGRYLFDILDSNEKLEEMFEMMNYKEGEELMNYALFEYRIGVRKSKFIKYIIRLLKHKEIYPKVKKFIPGLIKLRYKKVERFVK